MSDDAATPEVPDENDAGEQEPVDLKEKVRRLEQLVAGILMADAAAGAEAAAEAPVPQVGTTAPVADTAVPDAGGPWNWVGVSEERRKELAQDLTAFVQWLEERYLRHLSNEQYEFPANWHENPVVVEVLTAVMVAREAAYTDLLEEPSAALSEWHERALWPAIERLQSLGIFKDGKLLVRNRSVLTADSVAGDLARAAAESAKTLHGGSDEETMSAERDAGARTEPATEPIRVLPGGVVGEH
ncbi:hypothetical protein [Curtobacterium flaccumfaciens]|uniref:hypothetical protein n=1 Tax=Curtobacterium flaccumfaciens TaxID=2035 RepID=UPI0005ACE3BE|nr:hypothetical protein [Curtobacterium flaccumfaciens]KIQ07688.1 hypothetical protein RU06_10975 [Curtobacterium flaccumfaciens]